MLNFLAEMKLCPKAEWGNPPVNCAIFPGMCVNPDGTLALLCTSGSYYESSDQRLVSFIGSPDGMSWKMVGVWDELRVDGCVFDRCAKPSLAKNGTLVALGYGYVRDEPEITLSGYAEKHGHFPTVKNFAAFSNDGGATYSPPKFFDTPRGGIELTGPALCLDSGKMLAFGPPFNVDANGQVGLCYESDDNGLTWNEKSAYHEGGSITSWETRSAILPDGRIGVIFWAFDLETQKHLPNRLAISEDDGQTWCTTIDTGIQGQAASLITFDDGSFGIIYAKREGDNPGVYLANAKLDRNHFQILSTECLYDISVGANVNGEILTQFINIKFGQPSMKKLTDGTYLLLFWCKNPQGIYEVVLRKYEKLANSRPSRNSSASLLAQTMVR